MLPSEVLIKMVPVPGFISAIISEWAAQLQAQEKHEPQVAFRGFKDKSMKSISEFWEYIPGEIHPSSLTLTVRHHRNNCSQIPQVDGITKVFISM